MIACRQARRILVASTLFLLPGIFIPKLFWIDVGIPVSQEKVSNKLYLIPHKEVLLQPGPKNMVRRIFNAFLDYSFYRVCITNTSHTDGINGRQGIPMSLIFSSDNAVPPHETVEFQQAQTLCPEFSVDQSISATRIQFTPLPLNTVVWTSSNFTTDKATPTLYDQISASFILLIAWWTICLVFREIASWAQKLFSIV